MESYLRVVWQAVLVFPFAAALIALPFLIHHYRKYGSMTFARFFLSYSFVLYALCAYFLVILPLPSQEAVAQMTGPSVQLMPFSFFRDLATETGFQLARPATYLPALFSNFTLPVSYTHLAAGAGRASSSARPGRAPPPCLSRTCRCKCG